MAVMGKKSKKLEAEAVTADTAVAAEEDMEVEVKEEVKGKKKKKEKKAELIGDIEVKEEKSELQLVNSDEGVKEKKKKKKKNKGDTDVKEEGDVKSEVVTTDDTPSDVTATTEENGGKKKKKKSKESKTVELNSNIPVNGLDAEANDLETAGEEKGEKVEKPATDAKPKVSRANKAKNRLKEDLAYISSFMSLLHIPSHGGPGEEEEEGVVPEEARARLMLGRGAEGRAASREELQERLKAKMEQLRGGFGPNDKKKAKKLKRRMAAMEKEKEGKELKQKLMQIGINAGRKGKEALKEAEGMGAKVAKPGVKTDQGVVFSKFDFQEMEKEKKKNLDPESALRKIQKNKSKVKVWEEKGKQEKASKMEASMAWENAQAKAMGEKVKDDETLLKKAIKKKKQIKGSKAKKWEARVEAVESRKAGKQSKRDENIAKRKKEKKEGKMKKATAKGRHVPGF